MGTYHMWFCPRRREYAELNNIKALGFEAPDHAGALVWLITTRWSSEEILHCADSGGLYDRYATKAETEGWTNVWGTTWAEWTAMRRGAYFDHQKFDGRWELLGKNLWE